MTIDSQVTTLPYVVHVLFRIGPLTSHPMPHQAKAIANEFLRMQGDDPFITHMQLQKLVYIAHGWCLAVTGEPLVSEQPEAWDNGPVFRSLWESLKGRGSGVINQLIAPVTGPMSWVRKLGTPYKAELTTVEQDIIKTVWRKYKSFNGYELSEMTHQPGTPWTLTYFGEGRNSKIENGVVKRYFRELVRAGKK